MILYAQKDKIMEIKLNTEKINETLTTFYEMSNIRVVVFDTEYNIIAEYPKKRCSFCDQIRKVAALDEMCKQCDLNGFEKCKDENKIYIYKCHAGLVEAVIPLKYENITAGYIMFGQITDIKDKALLERRVASFAEKYGLKCDADGIKYKNKKKIEASAKILEICAEYIIFKDMIHPQDDRIVDQAKSYIRENLSKKITVDDICRICGCGRTKLYEMFDEKVGIGISHYIMKKRMALAKKLLTSTDLSISEIAYRCGFCDYNYFGKAYKKYYGIPPKTQRNELRKQTSD